MCHLCGKKSRAQTKPKKRKCSERNMVEKKNIAVNTRVAETYKHLRVKEKWRNQKER